MGLKIWRQVENPVKELDFLQHLPNVVKQLCQNHRKILKVYWLERVKQGFCIEGTNESKDFVLKQGR